MEEAFTMRYRPTPSIKAAVITLIAIGVMTDGNVCDGDNGAGVSTIDALFEMTSAFGTVGLSTE